MRTLTSGALGPWLAAVTLTAAGAAAAAGYALTAPEEYRATAQILVSPVSARDTTFTGIDVLRDTSGKRTAAASAAALVRTPLVADAVRALLGVRRSRDSLLDALDAHVVDASDVVAVSVTDTSATGAAQLANAFADTMLTQRTASFQSEAAAAIRRYSQLLERMTPAERFSPAGAELERRLTGLQALQGRRDPTLQQAAQATAPASSSWPDVWRLTGIGAGIGAAAGLLVAALLLVVRRNGRRAGPQYDRAVPDDRALEQLVDRLAARLEAREAALAAREKDLRKLLEEIRATPVQPEPPQPAPPDDSGLRRREQELEARVAAVTKRELEVARRAAAVAAREREVEEAEATLAASAEPGPEPEPRPAAGPARAREPDGYNLVALERLVTERGDEFPDRAQEWSSYLYFLREYAASDGSVPATFNPLIEDAFAELVS